MSRVHQQLVELATGGRGPVELTARVTAVIAESGVRTGICQVFCHHTSASLLITENADRQVLADLERYFSRLVPDGDALYRHTCEGPDDMPAHVRSVLTQSALSLPVTEARPALGTWQGVFLWEHRHAAHRRRLTVTVIGE